jgi:hypothetical protein
MLDSVEYQQYSTINFNVGILSLMASMVSLQNTDFVWRLFGKSAHLHYKFAYRNRVKDLVDEVSIKILKEAWAVHRKSTCRLDIHQGLSSLSH